MLLLILTLIGAMILAILFVYEVKKQTFDDICGTNFKHRKQHTLIDWFKQKPYSALNKYDDIND